VLDLLGCLVNKSLVTVETEARLETRYRMLETIRQYAHEKLVESGKSESVRDRHLMYYVEITEKVSRKIRGPDQPVILNKLEADHDNLRLALTWSLESQSLGNLELGLRLASALHWFWNIGGHNAEGLGWLERLLAAEAEKRDEEPLLPSKALYIAKALFVAGFLAMMIEEYHKQSDFLEKSLDLYREIEPAGKIDRAFAIIYSGNNADFDRQKKVEECLETFREAGDLFGMAECLLHMGFIALSAQEFERARKYWKESLLYRKNIADLDGAATDLCNMGYLAIIQGDEEQARALAEESWRMYSDTNDRYAINQSVALLGYLDWIQGEYELAADKFAEILSIGRRQGEAYFVKFGFSSLGRLALSQGNYDLATKKFSEGMAFNRRMGYKVGIIASLCDLGNLAWAQREDEQALKRYAEALDLGQETDEKTYAPGAFYGLGRAQAALADFASSRASFMKVISTLNIVELFYVFEEFMIQSLFVLEGLAYQEASEKKLERAIRLLGATQSWHERWQRVRTPRERHERESVMAELREEMGEEAFNVAWKGGQAMTLEQAVEYAKEQIFEP
jgi:tetratricopeptide (TPR) repeat protein